MSTIARRIEWDRLFLETTKEQLKRFESLLFLLYESRGGFDIICDERLARFSIYLGNHNRSLRLTASLGK